VLGADFLLLGVGELAAAVICWPDVLSGFL
jgi:hypothetical protein